MSGHLIYESYYLVIWVTAFFTAIVSATVGMVGGTMLLAVMAQYMKMEILIPLHGLVQLSSNLSRAWFLRESLKRKIVFENLFGIVLGSFLGSFYVVRVSEAYYNVFLGLFILLITFLPKFQVPLQFRGKWVLLGFVASFLGLFVGAVGVFVGSVFLAEKRMNKKELISTQALCQAALHTAKVLVFVSLGFVIAPWISLLIGTILFTIVGGWLGTQILEFIPEKIFRFVLTLVVSVLAVRLIVVGFDH